MNVEDIKAEIPNQFENDRDRLDHIFRRQHELASKYEAVEARNGLVHISLIGHEYPYNVDDRYAQARIKDFCWRVTEELAEMCEPISETHFFEEMSDAFHFLVELCIICGITSDAIMGRSFHENCRLEAYWRGLKTSSYERPVHRHYDSADVLKIIRELGLAANCLKQKPWKQTHQLTDTTAFNLRLKSAFFRFLDFARTTGMTADEFFRMYYSKSEVNNFRIRSNY